MDDYYLQIRAIHIGAVIASGSLMLFRGVAQNAGAAWSLARAVRFLSYAIDTMLLAAAVMLTMIIHQYPLVDGWLTTKLLLLVVYIVLGYNALRGRTAQLRWISLAGAALVFGFIISVARAHSPLGFFA